MKRLIPTCLLLFFIVVKAIAQEIPPIPAEERLKGIAKRKELSEKSLLKNLKFRNIGPTIMSGRAVDVDVNPDDPTEFYVAYASGGLWHTTNNGQSFTPLFDHEDVITIGDIAVNWKDHSIWVGTGEANSSRSSYSGTGVYFSPSPPKAGSDSCRIWIYKGLPESHHIGKVLIHPTDANTIFVAVLGHLYSANKDRGVYKTTDGGKSWKQVLYVDDNTGAVDLAMDPSNPSVLYAALWHRERRAWNMTESGKSSGIYKSNDGGETWQLLTDEKTGFPTGDGVGRIGLAVCYKNPAIVYAILDNQNHKPEEPKKDTAVLEVRDFKGITKERFLALDDKQLDKFLKSKDFPEKYTAAVVKDLVKKDSIKPSAVTNYLNDANNSLFDSPIIGAEVYRSDDGGKNWKKMNTDDLFKLNYTYGYYFGRIAVSPTDDNKIIVCGLPLLMSKDGGKIFVSIDGDNTHGDHHAVWIDPKRDSHIIICNDGGLNITYDEGKNWFKANTPPVGQFYSVCTDMAKPYNVYGGLQDNGVWAGPSTADPNDRGWLQSGNYPFKFIYSGDGMQVQVDTRDNNTVYTGFQFGYYSRVDKTSGESKDIKPKNDLGTPNYRFNWQTPIWLSRHCQDILYMGTNRFQRSMNKGEDMKAISEDLTMHDKKGDVPFNTIVTITESPLKFGLLYAGTDDGLLWRSDDDGYNWKNVSPPVPLRGSGEKNSWYVSRVTASSFKEGRVYVSLNGYRNDNFSPYLFSSDYYGDTWKEIDADLPYEPINVVKEDVVNENILYVGTDNGLYISIDKGKSYMAADSLPRAAVHDLVVHPREHEVVLGTHGRSIYIANIKELQQLNDSILAKPIHIFAMDDISFSNNWGKKTDPFSTEPYNTPVLTIPFYAKTNGVTTIRIKSEKGTLLKTITDTSEAGLNYVAYHLTMDSSVVKQFEKSASAATKKGEKKNPVVVKQAEDSNYYLIAGKYTIEITDDKKNTATATITVKEKE